MESSIVKDFQNLRVLASYDFGKMDALVQDLTNALEEEARPKGRSKCGAKQAVAAAGGSGGGGGTLKRNKRKCKKRKPSLSTWEQQANMSEASESSLDEALKDYMDNLAQRASDSDDLVLAARSLPSLAALASAVNPGCSLAESDSVNENCSPLRPHRRRRRYKRMAVDIDTDAALCNLIGGEDFPLSFASLTNAMTDVSLLPSTSVEGGAGRYQLLQEIKPGKRKRSVKDKCQGNSLDQDAASEETASNSEKGNSRPAKNIEAASNCETSSTTTASSSESDAVYTTDEGRDGDDEQSDFFHEPGTACGIPGIIPWWEQVPGASTQETQAKDAKFEEILQGSFQHMSPSSQRNFKVRLKMLGKPGREYRSGRRILKDRIPAYSVHSFLQERQHWRDSSRRYVLRYSGGGPGGPSGVSCERKRRRKTPPHSPTEEGHFVGENAGPIADSNIGSRILQSMGWTPGTGLGADGTGITTPIMAYRRPSRQGLGTKATAPASAACSTNHNS